MITNEEGPGRGQAEDETRRGHRPAQAEDEDDEKGHQGTPLDDEMAGSPLSPAAAGDHLQPVQEPGPCRPDSGQQTQAVEEDGGLPQGGSLEGEIEEIQ
jgi:hypothetical protein